VCVEGLSGKQPSVLKQIQRPVLLCRKEEEKEEYVMRRMCERKEKKKGRDWWLSREIVIYFSMHSEYITQ